MWWKDSEEEAKLEAAQRLEKVVADDERVARLTRRTQRIMRENNLAPDILKALGVRRT